MRDLTAKTIRMADMASEDRPREKAMIAGTVKVLSVTELMAVALGTGLPGRSVLDMSRDIFQSVNSRLRDLGRLEIDDLTNVKGVGVAKAVSLLAAIELGMRVARDMDSDHEDKQIKDSSSIALLMRDRLKNLNHEEFWVLMLDRRNRVISEYALSTGGSSGTVVDNKLLFRKAILTRASGIALVHNHPSGTLYPSPEDDRLTRRIREGAQMLDIRLLDHVIVTASGYYSYCDQGRL